MVKPERIIHFSECDVFLTQWLGSVYVRPGLIIKPLLHWHYTVNHSALSLSQQFPSVVSCVSRSVSKLFQQLHRPLETANQPQEDDAFAEPCASGDQIRDDIPTVTAHVISVVKLPENDLKPVYAKYSQKLQQNWNNRTTTFIITSYMSGNVVAFYRKK